MILNQITIPCTDYASSVEFYERLGLIQIVDAPPRYARFECAEGAGATLSLHAADNDLPGTTVIYFDHESADELDRHVEQLKAQGLKFKSAPIDQSWGWREARLKDPAGNDVCLMFAGDNRRFPPWRVDGKKPWIGP